MRLVPILALLIAPSLAAPPPDTPASVAEVGGLLLYPADVRAYLPAADADADAIRAAVGRVVRDAALALEARSILGSRAQHLPRAEAARQLLARLFDPGVRCRRLPEPLMRQHYGENAWRFQAPPAFEVDDIQLLCCRRPGGCQTLAVAECIERMAPTARTLRARLPDTADDAAFEAARERVATAIDDLAYKRYTFFYDPDHPDQPVHWQLQEVDTPIARAVAALAVGAISEPVVTRFGHHVLRLRARRPAAQYAFAHAHTQAALLTELCPPFLLQQREQYVQALLRQVPVQVSTAALERAFGVNLSVTAPGPP